MKVLVIVFFTSIISFFCYSQQNLNKQFPISSNSNNFLNNNYKEIDTNLVFTNIFELSKYSSKIMLDFDQYSRKEAINNPNNIYTLNSFKNRNIEMYCILLFKNLQILTKSNAELNRLYYVVNYTTTINAIKLQALFLQYPKNLRDSSTGIKIQNRINLKFANRGKNITPYLPETIKNKSNVIIPFPNLSNSKEKILLILGASWCAPCRFNDERIIRLINSKEINTNVRIIDISIEKDYKEWIKSIANKKVIKEHYLAVNGQNEKLYKSLGAHGVPFYFILNPDMTIAIQSNILDDILPYL